MAKLTPAQARAQYARIESGLRDRLARNTKLNDEQRARALRNFQVDPRTQRLREAAGMPQVQTRRQAVQETARRVVQREQQNSGSSDFGTALRAGLRRSMFGIPEHIAAAGLRFLPSSITGNESDASYSDILDLVRAKTDQEMELSTGGNILGQIMGSVAGGQGAVRAVQGAGRALTRVAPTVGRAITGATALQQGQRVRNAGKIVAAGAAGGAAQAAGEGSDIERGAAYGAALAPVAVAGVKGAEWLTRPARDFLRASSAKNILQRFTTATAEEISERADRFRQATGSEPSVFELLPLEDRQSLRDALKRMPGASRERAASLVRERTTNMGPELAARASDLTEGQQRVIARDLALDLARSRGATAPSAEELAMARRATLDPTEMENLRATEARNIMAPHDETVAFQTVDDMLPQSPRAENGTIIFEEADPEVSAAIRGAAGTLRLSENGVTVRDVTDIISDLRKDLARGGIEARAAQRAINHLTDTIQRELPDVGAAMGRMTDSFAGKSRMLEGMAEGRRTRSRADVPVTSRKDATKVRQLYDTPEGTRGRTVGQTSRLAGDFEGSPGGAMRRAQDIATSPATREAIAGNIGEVPTRALTEAAEAQTESARRLASLLPEQTAESGRGIETEDLVQSLAGLHPSAFLFTKFRTLAMMTRFFKGIPESRANAIVDALFSQDPRRTQAALGMLNNAGDTGQAFLNEFRNSLVSGKLGGAMGQAADDVSTDPAAVAEQGDMPATDEEGPWTQYQETAGEDEGPWTQYQDGGEGSVPYGQSVIQSIFPEVEVTDTLRDPESDLGQANPGSFHVSTDGAVDVRPIPGMTFEQFTAKIEDAGYEILEARDEVKNPSGHATGPHWHVVLA